MDRRGFCMVLEDRAALVSEIKHARCTELVLVSG